MFELSHLISSMSTRIYAKDQRYVYTHFKPPLLAGQSRQFNFLWSFSVLLQNLWSWFINDEVADNVCTSNSTLLSLALALVAFSYLHRTQDWSYKPCACFKVLIVYRLGYQQYSVTVLSNIMQLFLPGYLSAWVHKVWRQVCSVEKWWSRFASYSCNQKILWQKHTADCWGCRA